MTPQKKDPEKIYAMFRQKLSYTEIGDRENLTRCQVAGIIYRYRKKHGIEIAQRPRFQYKRKVRQKITTLPLDQLKTHSEASRWAEAGTCRFIVGHYPQGPYCAEQAIKGQSYCHAHKSHCYTGLYFKPGKNFRGRG